MGNNLSAGFYPDAFKHEACYISKQTLSESVFQKLNLMQGGQEGEWKYLPHCPILSKTHHDFRRQLISEEIIELVLPKIHKQDLKDDTGWRQRST